MLPAQKKEDIFQMPYYNCWPSLLWPDRKKRAKVENHDGWGDTGTEKKKRSQAKPNTDGVNQQNKTKYIVSSAIPSFHRRCCGPSVPFDMKLWNAFRKTTDPSISASNLKWLCPSHPLPFLLQKNISLTIHRNCKDTYERRKPAPPKHHVRD